MAPASARDPRTSAGQAYSPRSNPRRLAGRLSTAAVVAVALPALPVVAADLTSSTDFEDLFAVAADLGEFSRQTRLATEGVGLAAAARRHQQWPADSHAAEGSGREAEPPA